MPVTVEGLRAAYPIIDTAHYQACRIKYWLAEAQDDLRQCVWGKRWERGIYAYVAHKLIVELAELGMNDDGLGGMEANRGTVTGESDSVDGISHSTSYASSSSSAEASGAEGDWKTTIPGRDFLRMARIVSISRGAAYVE